MKNKEKFAKEILEIACDGNSIAIASNSGKLVRCRNIKCCECLFDFANCENDTREWAESEYIEKPVISKRDRAFLEYIKEEFKYIARDDINEQLFAWSAKPKRGFTTNEWLNTNGYSIGLYGFNLDLPMIKWEDEEPWLIEDLKKLEVVDEYE
nr:MAG TPA: hypothetical protein [Caudoviricetes sp.]